MLSITTKKFYIVMVASGFLILTHMFYREQPKKDETLVTSMESTEKIVEKLRLVEILTTHATEPTKVTQSALKVVQNKTKPIYDFGWMLGRNDLRLFMRKEDEKPLIEPSNWTLLPQHAYFGCIVISAPQHAEMRNGIRKTWGQLMKPIFIMGLHDVKTLLSVEHESQIYDDIIVEDFVDNYLNLTIKAAYAFGAFLKYFGGSKYFVKADDDIFLSVENLHVLLGTVPEHKLVGNVVSHSKPVRSDRSKWYMPKFLYPWDMYPPYLLGYAVVIPGHLVRSIYEIGLRIPFHTIDDAFFLGDVSTKILKYELHHSNNFRVVPVSTKDPCAYKDLIAVHKINSQTLINLFDKLKNESLCNVIDTKYLNNSLSTT